MTSEYDDLRTWENDRMNDEEMIDRGLQADEVGPDLALGLGYAHQESLLLGAELDAPESLRIAKSLLVWPETVAGRLADAISKDDPADLLRLAEACAACAALLEAMCERVQSAVLTKLAEKQCGGE